MGCGVSMGTVLFDTLYNIRNKNVSKRTVPYDTKERRKHAGYQEDKRRF